MERGDRRPLLSHSDEDDGTNPDSDIKRLIRRHRERKSAEDALCPDLINVYEDEDQRGSYVQDNVVAVFVIAFDTRHGNILEWCMPEDSDLECVEFKAMPSGAHTVPADFLYFRKNNLYGLSCFEKMAVDSAEERGIRMKSVGVLAASYATFHRYKQFLETQVRQQLESPGDYDKLVTFYDEKKGVLPSSILDQQIPYTIPISASSDKNGLPTMQITHPTGCFTLLVRFFGESIFILWKLVLLQKRLLFFSPPPIGVVCYRVYCASCLSRHAFTQRTRKTVKPYFYVNISDIEQLESETSYIACTTEKVFCEKPHLYDVYVDNRIIKSCDPSLKSVLKTSRCDGEKYQQLLNLKQEYVFLERIGEAEHQNEEEMFISFFSERNNRLFATLFNVSDSDNKTLTADHMRSMGLDPSGDRQFLLLLLETYGIDATLVVDDPCCPI